MQKLFLDVLNLSIVSAWFILAVLCLRLIIKRVAPRWTVCMLWGLVALCLIIPFSFESKFSLIPSRQIVIYSDAPSVEAPTEENTEADSSVAAPNNIPGGFHINSGFSSLDERLNTIIASMEHKNDPTEPTEQKTDYGKLILQWASYIWVSGFVLMLGYFSFNLISLKIKLKKAMQYQDNVYIDESIGAPFLFGFVKPKIYIPLDVTDEAETYVLAHERAHIKRFDHLVKPFSFILLAIHWFNPFVWVSYNMLCRDIEYACDEKVIKNFDEDERKQYATALLECGVKSVGIAYPVAFGEISVKNRIIKTLNYKRPTLWIILTIIVATAIMAVCFLSSPKLVTTINEPDIAPINQQVLGAWYAEDHSLILEKDGEGICYSNGVLVPFTWTIDKSSLNIILTEEYKSAIDLPTQTDYTLGEDGKSLTLGSTIYSDTFTPKPRDDIDSALVGAWYSYSIVDGENAFIFNADGSGSLANNELAHFNWTAKDGEISIKFKVTDKQNYTLKGKDYKLEGDTLTFFFGIKYKFSKNKLSLAGDYKLIGDWALEDEVLTLEPDGTGKLENKYSVRHFLWGQNGDSISFYNHDDTTFIPEDDPRKTELTYMLNKDKLTVSFKGKEYELTYQGNRQADSLSSDPSHSLGGDATVTGSWLGTFASEDELLDLSINSDGTGSAKVYGIDIPVKWYTDSENGNIAIYYNLTDDTAIDIFYGKYYVVENALYISDVSGLVLCLAKADTNTTSYALTMEEITQVDHEGYLNTGYLGYIYHEEADGTTYFNFTVSCTVNDFEFTNNGNPLFSDSELEIGEVFAVRTTIGDSANVKGVKFTDPNGNTLAFTIGAYGVYAPVYTVEQFTIN